MSVKIKASVKVGNVPVKNAEVKMIVLDAQGQNSNDETDAYGEVHWDPADDSLVGKVVRGTVIEERFKVVEKTLTKDGVNELPFWIPDPAGPVRPPTFAERLFGAACLNREIYALVARDEKMLPAYGVLAMGVAAFVAASACRAYVKVGTMNLQRLDAIAPVGIAFVAIGLGLAVTYALATQLLPPAGAAPSFRRYFRTASLSASPLLWAFAAPLLLAETLSLVDVGLFVLIFTGALFAGHTAASVIAVQESLDYAGKPWHGRILGVVTVLVAWGVVVFMLV